MSLGIGRERKLEICRHLRLRPCFRRLNRQRHPVAYVCVSVSPQRFVDPGPVASLTVWFERSSKGETIDGPFDHDHATGRELRAGVLGQPKKSP